jgi:hypothetical protein
MSNRTKVYAILYDRDEVDTESLHNFIAENDTVYNW